MRIYRTVIRPIITYAAETMSMPGKEEKLRIAEELKWENIIQRTKNKIVGVCLESKYRKYNKCNNTIKISE